MLTTSCEHGRAAPLAVDMTPRPPRVGKDCLVDLSGADPVMLHGRADVGETPFGAISCNEDMRHAHVILA
jgi:hypothetical protein